VERGWLGVNVRDVTPDQAKSLGLGTPHGAFIADVTKGGPADKAALNKGDVVLSYQGKDIPDAAALRNDVANSPVDQEVKITVWRNGKKQNLRVKTGNLEELTKMLTTSLKEKLGVEVRPMTVQEAEQYGMRAPEGVVIRWIDPKGRLGKAGFEVGDIILAVDGHPVEDVVSFSRIVETIPQHHKAVLLAVDHRTGEASYVKVELG
jgi:serine protease Do